MRLLLALSVVVYALGFLHLRADFPNGSPWPDTAKMADEGWYAGAAIHHFVQGRWDLPGLLHPAVAMPVWPAMLGVWFDVTSVSMLWARVLTMLLYGVSLVLLYRLMWKARPGRVAAVVVLLTVIDPFCYAFDRLAILEPVTVVWFLLALWIAGGTEFGEWWKEVLLGVVIALLVLTKRCGRGAGAGGALYAVGEVGMAGVARGCGGAGVAGMVVVVGRCGGVVGGVCAAGGDASSCWRTGRRWRVCMRRGCSWMRARSGVGDVAGWGMDWAGGVLGGGGGCGAVGGVAAGALEAAAVWCGGDRGGRADGVCRILRRCSAAVLCGDRDAGDDGVGAGRGSGGGPPACGARGQAACAGLLGRRCWCCWWRWG